MKSLLCSFLLLGAASLHAQLDPVSWSFAVEKISEQQYEVTFTADIAHGWSVYSQHLDPNAGPVPTSFEFQTTSSITPLGPTQESGNKQEVFDEIFGTNLIKFSRKVKFTQRFETSLEAPALRGKLTYMTCNGQSCLPPTDVPFEIRLK